VLTSDDEMKVKVAFYKGKGSWKNRVIRWWTKSKYSHAELIMPDNFTWISISPLLTSKVQSRINTDFNPEIWELVSIEVSAEQVQVINDFFEETKGCKYDWIGMILSQFLPCKIKHRHRWYCSEWIAYALRISDVFNWKTIKIYDQTDLSPQRLYEILSHKDLEE
jgi:hypothetical protein